jgi:hypothetical protein
MSHAACAEDAPGACSGALAGTYLTAITAGNGAFASRSIVTIHGDGRISAIDSNQHSGVQQSGFSAQEGVYRCMGSGGARATTLNFSFPPRESIARSDWTIEVDKATGAISGTITLHVYAGMAGVDPFGAGGRRIDTFRFTSRRVTAPAR